MNYQYLDLNYLLLLTVLFRARSLNFVEKTLPLKIKEMILWTYSKCILLWLRSKKMLSPFTQRREDEIKSSGNTDFSYVPTYDNPGDISSRGMGTKELQECTLRWHRPNWLSQGKDNWTIWNIYEEEILADISTETKRPKTMLEISSAEGEGPLEISHKSKGGESSNHNKFLQNNLKAPFEKMVKSFSSLCKLLRITA